MTMYETVRDSNFSIKRLSSLIVSAQDLAHQKLTTIANTLSNTSTTGFKTAYLKTKVIEHENSKGQKISYPRVDGIYFDFSQGGIKNTGVKSHCALMGKGFFKVETPKGIRYTRNGEFLINAQRQLTDVNGHLLMSNEQNPIQMPEESHEITIDKSGIVRSHDTTLGRLSVVQFQNETLLEAQGGSLFKTTQDELPSDATVLQGVVELSNVSPVQELVHLIELQNLTMNLKDVFDEYDKNLKRTMNTDKGQPV